MTVDTRLAEIASEVAKKRAVEFVHCQLAGSRRNLTVRVFIDKPSGVTVEDCADVSRDIEAVLDAEDLIPSTYVLEVSSPGIERGLFNIGDFEKFKGQAARIKMAEPIDGQRNFIGTIAAVENDDIVIEDRSRGRVRLSHDKVAKANLVVDLSKEFRKSRQA
jgi:ribosome maturation factor RimP